MRPVHTALRAQAHVNATRHVDMAVIHTGLEEMAVDIEGECVATCPTFRCPSCFSGHFSLAAILAPLRKQERERRQKGCCHEPLKWIPHSLCVTSSLLKGCPVFSTDKTTTTKILQ